MDRDEVQQQILVPALMRNAFRLPRNTLEIHAVMDGRPHFHMRVNLAALWRDGRPRLKPLEFQFVAFLKDCFDWQHPKTYPIRQMERRAGFEPASPEYKTGILPLDERCGNHPKTKAVPTPRTIAITSVQPTMSVIREIFLALM